VAAGAGLISASVISTGQTVYALDTSGGWPYARTSEEDTMASGDEFLRGLEADIRRALVVAHDELQRAAEVAADGVDLVHGQLQAVEGELRLEGERARDRQDITHLDLARLGAPDRGSAERGHGPGRADGAEEAATAERGSIATARGIRHRVLRREMVGSDGREPSILAARFARRRPG